MKSNCYSYTFLYPLYEKILVFFEFLEKMTMIAAIVTVKLAM